MKNFNLKDSKNIATISYLTIIGLVIAYILNKEKNNYFVSFHIRQSIGLHLLFFINKWIIYGYFGSTAGNIGKIGVIVLFVLGAVAALQEELKLVPLFGEKFQEWFKNI
ncbi:MAG: hypothetical protein AB8B78_11300 [Polaribacter sp.]